MDKPILIFLLAILVGFVNCKSPKSTVSKTESSETIDSLKLELDQQIPIWMSETNTPCVGIGFIENGTLKWSEVYGHVRDSIEANINTLFYLASIHKTYIGMLTMKLSELDLWDLDEPLYKYWIDPDVSEDARHKLLTTRHILSHQSGFPNWRNDKEPNVLKFEFNPGMKYQYSGEGIEYLIKALESKFESSIEKLLDDYLLSPLNLNDTRMKWSESLDDKRFAYHHNSRGEIYEKDYAKLLERGGSMLTTIHDFSQLM